MKKTASVLLLLAAATGLAQEGLYDPAPPADSAFVRIFNADKGNLTATIHQKDYAALQALGTSDYRVIPEGTFNTSFNKTSLRQTFKAGKYYTLVWQASKATLLEDLPNTNRAKALITLYNLSDSKNILLKTGDGKVTVLQDIDPGKSKSQAVNGIKVALSVLSGSNTVEAFKETQLERGAAYSVFVTGTGKNLQATWVQSRTSTR